MKKKYLIPVGALILAVLVSGCGKKKQEEAPVQQPEVTEAPAALTPTPVEMQKTDANIVNAEANVLGTRSETASQLVLINQTGAEVDNIFIRQTPGEDDVADEWGDDLVQHRFTLKNGERALYYYETDQKDAQGKTVTSFDIMISYTDTSRSECFFRNLPLTTIRQLTLLMDGEGDESIPYAKYLTVSSDREFSTLEDVKRRLGYYYQEEETGRNENEQREAEPSQAPQPSLTPAPEQTQAPTATPVPENTPDNTPQETAPQEPAPEETIGDEDSDPEDWVQETVDEAASRASAYVGQPLENLISGIGSPSGSEYQEEPESGGKTGYHYYDTFTVSTVVDENGNETVASIW